MKPQLTLKKQSLFKETWRRMKKHKGAMVGLVLLALIVSAVVFTPFFLPEKGVTKQNMRNRFALPSTENLLGTDNFGRDVFTRLMYGGRVSVTIGLISALTSLAIGGTIGLIVGYYGGHLDNIVMRGVDVLSAIPTILLAIAIVSALGTTLQNLLIAVSISRVPAFIRVIRASTLNIVDMEYTEAAHAGGTSDFRIITRHILPNVMGTVIVQTTMSAATLLLQAAALSFLGLGIQPPNPEWGAMLSDAREYMRVAPQLMIYPGVLIVITTLALNLIGDGLRDAFDPRLRD
jgi:peptide/nickel transport system permease protein